MKRSRRKKGYDGEQIAKEFLQSLGYCFLTQNVYTPFGEIDLIFADAKIMVFVEVKLRSSQQFGSILEQVSSTKRRRWIKSAQFVLDSALFECYEEYRFDYIAVFLDLSSLKDKSQITHIKDAFDVSDEMI